LACLDGVLVRMDAMRRAIDRGSNSAIANHVPATIDYEDAAVKLVDPSVCARATPPRLATSLSDSAIAVLAIPSHDDALQPPEVPTSASCGRALAGLVEASRPSRGNVREAAADALTAAETCGDDRILFDALVARARSETSLISVTPKAVELERRID